MIDIFMLSGLISFLDTQQVSVRTILGTDLADISYIIIIYEFQHQTCLTSLLHIRNIK